MAQPIRVLLVGAGGREHALAWRLRQENPDIEIIAAPGNPGIAELAECVPVAATDVQSLLNIAKDRSVDWTLVGPEAPLALGIVDSFRAAGLAIFGPTKAAAMLEASKEFSKAVMIDAGVPTADAMVCSNVDDACAAITKLGAPVVIKASGLAAGKGVIVCETEDEARAAAKSMLEENAFGAAGATILVEEFMTGEELSIFVLTDGNRAVVLPAAQDHKRLLNDDLGPNTGGMGAYSPVSLIDEQPHLVDEVLDRVVFPTLAAMRARGTPFTGLLYVGLMITPDGPKVVEFNCRFGDPETQAVLLAIPLETRVTDIMRSIALGEALPKNDRLLTVGAAVTTVLAASGYPESPTTGDVITVETPAAGAGGFVFHAGTKRDGAGELVTAGGRVLTVTGFAGTFEGARQKSQTLAHDIQFTGKQFRTDIGSRELARRAGAT